eukprot:gene57177-biopygen111159
MNGLLAPPLLAALVRGCSGACTVQVYADDDYIGLLDTKTSSSTSGQKFMFPAEIEDQISSVKLSGGCNKVELWDNDGDCDEIEDNKMLTESNPNIGTTGFGDLDNDVCAVKIWATPSAAPPPAAPPPPPGLESFLWR